MCNELSTHKLDYFKQIFLQVLSDHAPLSRVCIKNKRMPWVTREYRIRWTLGAHLSNNSEPPHLLMTKRSTGGVGNRGRTLLRASKRAHFSHLITGKVNPITLWRARKSAVLPSIFRLVLLPDSAEPLAAKCNQHFFSISPLALPPACGICFNIYYICQTC